jgi:hypothetical protein
LSARIVVLFFVALLTPALFPPVAAFRVVDQAMCKDAKCMQRTDQFLLTDEFAYFWFKGALEASDAGANLGFTFYDPCGHAFVTGPSKKTVVTNPRGEIEGFIGLVIAEKLAGGMLVGLMLSGGAGIMAGQEQVMNRGWAEMSVGESMPTASQKPGEWQAEFTLADRVIASERFRIGPGTTTCATGLSVDLPLIAGVAVCVGAVAVVAIFALRRRTATKSPPATAANNVGTHPTQRTNEIPHG